MTGDSALTPNAASNPTMAEKARDMAEILDGDSCILDDVAPARDEVLIAFADVTFR